MLVCHNGVEICISKNALEAHLKHGDKCGPCATQAKLKNGNLGFFPENEFTLYPNPFNTTIHLKLPEGLNNVSLKIYDATGHTVKIVDSLNSTTVIDMTEMGAGFYFFTVSDDTGLLDSGKIIRN